MSDGTMVEPDWSSYSLHISPPDPYEPGDDPRWSLICTLPHTDIRERVVMSDLRNIMVALWRSYDMAHLMEAIREHHRWHHSSVELR